MIPTNTFDMVFNIKVNQQSTGTCFTLTNNSKKYLITAKHVLGDLSKVPSMLIETSNGWEKINHNRIITPDNPEADIAAIELTEPTISELKFVTFDYSTNGIILAADSYFLGYPYGLKNFNMGNSRGMPIIKKAIISGDAYDQSGSHIGFLLDGHNNPGFSGGPCVTKNSSGTWSVFGVISSYICQPHSLQSFPNENRIIKENSGIINSHSIDLIIKKLQQRAG